MNERKPQFYAGSRTQPSTPERNQGRISQSVGGTLRRTNESRFSEIGLPPHELGTITQKLSQEAMSAPGSSRRIRRNNRRPLQSVGVIEIFQQKPGFQDLGERSTKRRFTEERAHVKNIRTEADRKRRRSSFIITQTGDRVFDVNYVGPITIDFLRFFCKISKEEEKEQESERNNLHGEKGLNSIPDTVSYRRESYLTLSDENKSQKDTSAVPDDFGHSLLLPDSSEDPLDISESNNNNESPNRSLRLTINFDKKKPSSGTSSKKFSYLERILAVEAQKERGEEIEIQNITHEMQNQTSAGTEDIESTSKDINFDGRNEHSKQIIGSEHVDPNARGESSSGIEEDRYRILDGDAEFTSIDKDIGQSEEPLITTEIADDLYNNKNENMLIHEDFDEHILENFIEDAVEIQQGELELDLSNCNTDDVGDISPESGSIDKVSVVPIHGLNLMKKDPPRFPQSSTSIPVNMIKNLVKSIRSSLNSDLQPKNKRKKLKNIGSEVYSIIQERSEEFLSQVMNDITEYSKHRTNSRGKSITIKDVLLYLKRVRIIDQKDSIQSNIETLENMAHNLLPLEVMLALGNSLEEYGAEQDNYENTSDEE